jgi:glycosyltransferase involved in cell wall biosynthesis
MSTVAPYIIQHINLDNLPGDDTLAANPEFQYYCCFWWKEIPLGHLFIEKGTARERSFLLQQMGNAIAPAIDCYAAKLAMPAIDVKRLLAEKQYPALCTEMESLLSSYTHNSEQAMPQVSVIICTRNRSNDLKRCLRSLQHQLSPAAEIIIVDNAPTDNSTLEVAQQFNQVVYCREPRGGLSIARNTGIRQATSPVIAFTDDDVILHPMWLYHVKKTFQTPEVAAMTGLVIASSLKTESQQLFEKEWSFNGGYCDKLYNSAFFANSLRQGPRVWEIGAGANMAFRKSALAVTGLFDERLGAGASGCSEDSEIWYRLLAKGFAIQYNPRAVVFHEHRRELEALYRQLYSYMKGHAVAALIQQTQIKEAGYRRYLRRKVVKGYLPLLASRFFNPFQRRLLLIQLRGLFAGVLFFLRNKNKPSNINA